MICKHPSLKRLLTQALSLSVSQQIASKYPIILPYVSNLLHAFDDVQTQKYENIRTRFL